MECQKGYYLCLFLRNRKRFDLGVVLKISLCMYPVLSKNKEKEQGLLNVVECMKWYVGHEPDCQINHEGFSAVSV